MDKAVWVTCVLPKLDVIPKKSQRFAFPHPGSGQAEKVDVVLWIVYPHRRQIVSKLLTRKGVDPLSGVELLF